MAATIATQLEAERRVRDASAKRNAYNAALFGNMHRQRVAEEASEPSKLLPPPPSYADLSGLLTELSQRDRNFQEEDEACTRELLKLTGNNERLAREFMRSLTQKQRLFFVELNDPIMRDLQLHFSTRSVSAATFSAFIAKWLRDYEEEQPTAAPATAATAAPSSFDSDRGAASEPASVTVTPVKPVVPKNPTQPEKRADIINQMKDSPLFKKRVAQRLEEEGAMITEGGKQRKEPNIEALKQAGASTVDDIWQSMLGGTSSQADAMLEAVKAMDKGDGKKRSSQKGMGVRFHQKLIRGKGAATRTYICCGLYWVNLTKLKDGILEVNYSSNNQAKLKPISVSRDVVGVVRNILDDRFNLKEYSTLTDREKRTVEHFVQVCGLSDRIDIGSKHVDELFQQYEKLVGELEAGNNSPKIMPKLQALTLELQRLKRIPPREASAMLAQFIEVD